MKVEVAESAGFCFGVKRALDMVYEAASSSQALYTYGPIIHNDTVVEDLEAKGIGVIRTQEELKRLKKGTIVIRSHGVSQKTYQGIEEQGLNIIDATCPFVKKIHRAVKEHSEAGNGVLIFGNEAHPEVEGIKGWCDGPVFVIETAEEAEKFAPKIAGTLCIVAQTTFNYKKFKDLVEIISKKGYDILALNTICNATQERQAQAARLAGNSDTMLVIGGRQSSNTQKLFEICKKECENTYYIQTLADLDLSVFKSSRSVGITAGASTPNNIIKEVQKHVRNEL